MTIKTITADIDVPHTIETQVCDAVSHTIETGEELPEYLTITALDREHYPDFLRSIADRARNQSLARAKATFKLDTHSESIPDDLYRLIDSLNASFEEWRQVTVIRENFSDETLTAHLFVHFDETGVPSSASLSLGFEMWGLPESGMPTFEDAVQS